MSAFVAASSDSEAEEAGATNEYAEEGEIDAAAELEGDDEYIEFNDEFAVIAAIPPKITTPEEDHMVVLASPAFHQLDELYNDGKLSATKLALLKDKYRQLNELLRSKRSSEHRLLQKAKEYTNILDLQRQQLAKADTFPEDSDSEVSKLRLTLLTYSNDLVETEERQYQLDYKIQCLEEDKKMFEKEYARLPKLGEFEAKQEELKSSITELRKEINQRKNEIKALREVLESNVRRNDVETKAVAGQLQRIDSLTNELAVLCWNPTSQVGKEVDKLEKQKLEADNNLQEIDNQVKELMSQLEEINSTMAQMELEKNKLDLDKHENEMALQDQERRLQELSKDLEYAKEREAVLLIDRATIDASLRHAGTDHAHERSRLKRDFGSKDAELRKLKKANLQLKMAQDSLTQVKLAHEKRTIEISMIPKDNGSLRKQVMDLSREIAYIKGNLITESGVEKTEADKIEQSIAEEERLLYEESDVHMKLVELTRLAFIKREEQDNKIRELHRAKYNYEKVKEDLQTREIQLEDHKKKNHEMQLRLAEFAHLYGVIKNERNQYVNLILGASQRASEMKEKVKIFDNEIEILRTSATQKDKQLQKLRLKRVHSLIIQHSLRSEVAKQRALADEQSEKQKQVGFDMDKINSAINKSEQEMLLRRKQLDQETQRRNDRGIQLIERNEELCAFYEKANIYDGMLRNGDVEEQAREEEIRFLKVELAEEQRKVNLLRKSLPNKKLVEQELVSLQIQLSQCQDEQMKLEGQVENPNNEHRVRFIEGKNLTPDEIRQKCEEIETRLAAKERLAMEKDLVYEQVSRLTERVADTVKTGKEDTLTLARKVSRLTERVADTVKTGKEDTLTLARKVSRLTERVADTVKTGKEDTLTLARKVNKLQACIRNMTRQMMAKVSELSLQQANALRLQQDIRQRQGALDLCYVNMEKGLPPSFEIEQEWIRKVQQKQQRASDREQELSPLDVASTAETRPNAYIPTDDSELPIPRPYGAHAPFKPSEQGSTMRHIRKPVPRPIEL